MASRAAAMRQSPTDTRPVAYITLSPFVGGAERSLVRIAGAIDRQRYRPFVITGCPGEFPRLLATAGVDFRRIVLAMPQRSWPLPFARSVGQLVLELRRRRTALLHVNDAPAYPQAGIAGRFLRLPRVCHLQFTYDADGLRWYLKYGFERAVFPSQFMKRYAQTQCPALFPEERCAVIHNGFDPPRSPDPYHLARLRQALSLTPADTVFGFVGRVIEIKGVKDYLLAAAELLRRHPSARFLIVGDDLQTPSGYRRRMEELTHTLGIAHACRFTGYREDYWELLHLCDVVLMPSHIEAFGNVALEAGGAGRAVVASRTGGLTEIVCHGETGLLVPPADPPALVAAAAQLVGDSDLRRRLGEQARQRVLGHFSMTQQVRQLADLYDVVIAEQQRRTSAGAPAAGR